MIDDTDTSALISKINQWLDDPQTHLDGKSRRKILEMIVNEHVGKIRRAERARGHARDLLLLASVVTLLYSLFPEIMAMLKAGGK